MGRAAEPFLHQVERDTGGDGGGAEAVAQSLGRDLRPVETGGVRHRVHGAPASAFMRC